VYSPLKSTWSGGIPRGEVVLEFPAARSAPPLLFEEKLTAFVPPASRSEKIISVFFHEASIVT